MKKPNLKSKAVNPELALSNAFKKNVQKLRVYFGKKFLITSENGFNRLPSSSICISKSGVSKKDLVNNSTVWIVFEHNRTDDYGYHMKIQFYPPKGTSTIRWIATTHLLSEQFRTAAILFLEKNDISGLLLIPKAIN